MPAAKVIQQWWWRNE